MRKRWLLYLLVAVSMLFLVVVFVYYIPPVHNRLSWRVASLRTQIQHALNPPQEVVFVPQAGTKTSVSLPHLTPTAEFVYTDPPTTTPTMAAPEATNTPVSTPTPSMAPTPIPESVILIGTVHEYQQMNNCGPATLAMTLSFWGWEGDQRDKTAYLRPNFRQVDDKNINPAEMVDFVETQTDLKVLARTGGDVELLKQLIATGFPVMFEKGQQPHPGDWMGHYALFDGYDDTKGRFSSQDAYIMADLPVPHEKVNGHWWRDFNYTYLVIYPPEREGDVLSILGPQPDETYNHQYTAEKAQAEIETLEGRDIFFAWYNLGSSLIALSDYEGATQAYDQAFSIYPTIPEDDRPWRMLWYQTGPYVAYYNMNRYQDVITLGNQTLNMAGGPILEETFYWLGRAREATGDLEKAIYDYRKAYEIKPLSTPALEELKRLGIET